MTEPVSVATAKLNSRIDGDEEDALIASWIVTGRRWVENYTGHILVQRDVTERFDDFRRMRLRAWPIAPDADVLLTYTDTAGVSQIFADYRLDVGERPALLQPAFGVSWPFGSGGSRSVSATFRAGYATPEDVPAEMIAAILVIVDGLWKHRTLTDDHERAAASLCRSYQVWSV